MISSSSSLNQSPFLLISLTKSQKLTSKQPIFTPKNSSKRKLSVLIRCSEKEPEKRKSFLTLEEAGLVEMSGLSTHERFLCRLTISSLNLLRVVAEEEGCDIEELNAGRVCDWFVKDKLKREQNLDSAVLQWDDSEFQF
ncbi:hypothetical protein M5689_008704 [Euphorbia peplus]|nr:hypothetical protein M5689_008704 [Euphorbia peplus]